MTIAAVIFDMDGTLIDSEVLWVEAIEAALTDRNVSVTREAMSRLVYGRAWTDIYADIERLYPDVYASRADIEAFTEPLFKRLSRERDIRIEPSVDLLRKLGRHLPLAIVSGSTRGRILETVQDLDIDDVVDIVLGCEDVDEGKPSPKGFLQAASRLGVVPEACLVFEDSAAGVKAAKAAGMACVALSRTNAEDQVLDAADAVLTTLEDFDPERFGLEVNG